MIYKEGHQTYRTRDISSRRMLYESWAQLVKSRAQEEVKTSLRSGWEEKSHWGWPSLQAEQLNYICCFSWQDCHAAICKIPLVRNSCFWPRTCVPSSPVDGRHKIFENVTSCFTYSDKCPHFMNARYGWESPRLRARRGADKTEQTTWSKAVGPADARGW